MTQKVTTPWFTSNPLDILVRKLLMYWEELSSIATKMLL